MTVQILKHGKYYHPLQLCICPKCECKFVVNECEHFIEEYND